MKSACILLATGFEEVELVTPLDYLRRAGIETTLASLDDSLVAGAHGIKIQADTNLSSLKNSHFDCIVIPGGAGAKLIASNQSAIDIIKAHYDKHALIVAICAAPALVLGQACGLLKNKYFTCYPDMESLVPEGKFKAESVVIDGNIITARGPNYAGEFSIKIIESLLGSQAANKVAKETLFIS